VTYASLCNETYENALRLPANSMLKISTTLRLIVTANLFVSFTGLLLAQSALIISPQSLPYGAVGSSYSAQLSANGSGNYQWSVSQGSLPPGLSLGPTSGTIAGTPTTGGSYPFTVMVLDTQTQQTASKTYTVGIMYITNSSPLPSATTSMSYSVTFNAADGPAGNYNWSIDTTPPGLMLGATTGTLSGTPTTSGTFNFNITVTESAPPGVAAFPTLSTSKAFSLIIQPATGSGLTISPSSLPFGALGSSYSAQLRANGSGFYRWAVTQGSLPPGLSLGGANGTMSGTTSAGGTYPFVVTVTDLRTEQVGSAGFAIGILNISNSSPLPSGSTSSPYSVSFNASDGPPGAATWSIDMPPGGLTLSGNVLSGNPSMTGTFNFNITVTVGGLSVTKGFALTIGSSLTITDPPVLPAGDVNVQYGYSFNVVGGPASFSWSLAGGAPPPGTKAFDLFDPSVRTVSGTPSGTGTFTFTVQVQDHAQNTAMKQFSLTINPALAISNTSLPGGTTGASYAQVITASGGTPPYTFSIANAPPGLSIDPKSGLLTGTPTTAGPFSPVVMVKDFASQGVFPGTASKTFSLTIASSTPEVTAAPESLSFTGAAGGDSPPAQVIVALPAGVSTAGFQVVIDSGQDGSAPAAWLAVSPTSGNTPARLVVRVDQGSMPAGNYSGRIRVIDASNNPTDVPVTLTLTSAAQLLDIVPRVLHFAAHIQAPGTLDQIIVVRNSGGGGPLGFNAAVLGASPWISNVTPNAGQTAHNAPVFLHVRINTQGLQVGSYHDVIRLSSAAGNVDVSISLFVANSGSILGVDITGVTFHGQQSSGYSHAQKIRVLNLGDPGTSVNWAVDVPYGDTLVSPSPASGTAMPATPGTLTLTPSANAVSLAAGGYYALVRISDAQSLNSPQYVVVVLDQRSSSAAAPPDPTPSGLFFTAAAGGAAPAAQQVAISANNTSPFQAATSTTDGGNWLNASPTGGAAGPIAVSVNIAGLAPGIYTGEVDISTSGAVLGAMLDAVASVDVTLVVRPAGTIAALEEAPVATALADVQAAGCTPSKLALTQTGLVNNFSVPAQWPAALIVQLNDDCGAAVTNGSVVASFSNGDPPLSLRGDGRDGTYSTTWQAGVVSPQMVVTLQAAAGTLQPATAQLTGGISQNQAPVLARNGTLHNLNPVVGGPLAPGTISQVYGSGLAATTTSPGVLPLPTTFGGTFMLIGGISAPLYYLSSGQLNVQIPSELAPNQQYATIVSANGALTLPDQIDVVPAVPGVAATADGHVIAQHGLDYSLVDAGHPAKPGEYLIIYLAGMGATNPGVASGAISPLAPATMQPTVTVDGQTAVVVYAGLSPGSAGLYQINFQVPASAQTGDLSLAVTQNGMAANAAKLPVSQ
jgi:uncharacterized protein (TIGR03437 family)